MEIGDENLGTGHFLWPGFWLKRNWLGPVFM